MPCFSSTRQLEAKEVWTKSAKSDIRIPGLLRIVNEGIAHHGDSWILSNKYVLLKTSIDPVIVQLTNEHAIPKELWDLSYDHIGDIDVCDGIIYGGLEAKNKDAMGVIVTWNATDLSLLNYATTTKTHGMPWIAVDPSSNLLYSADWDGAELQVYDRNTFLWVRSIPIMDLPSEIQGGAFYKGELYLACNGEDSIWKVDFKSSTVELVLLDQYDREHFSEYEMEGIDFFDLSDRDMGIMHMFGNFMTVKEKSIHNFVPKI